MTPAETFRYLIENHVKREGAKPLLEWIEKTDFFSAPASTRFHGSYPGGLCEHSIHVYEELTRLLAVYPEIKPSAETVVIITLLHDLCKIGCYEQDIRNVKVNGVWTQQPCYKFNEKYPFGTHGGKSVYLIQRYMPLTAEEAVAINCHMGFADKPQGDFSVSKAFEKYPLAWLLHVADESASYIREKQEEI